MFKKEGETFSFYGRGPKSQSERSTQTQPGAWPACGTQSSFSHEGKWMRTATVPHSPREATFDLLCHSQKLSLVLVTGTGFMTCFRGRRVGAIQQTFIDLLITQSPILNTMCHTQPAGHRRPWKSLRLHDANTTTLISWDERKARMKDPNLGH